MNAPDSPCLWTYSRLMEMTEPMWERDVMAQVAVLYTTIERMVEMMPPDCYIFPPLFDFARALRLCRRCGEIGRVWFVLDLGWVVEVAGWH